MEWTTEKPTEEGFYLWRNIYGVYIAEVASTKKGLVQWWISKEFGNTQHEALEEMGGEWAGPIPEPAVRQ